MSKWVLLGTTMPGPAIVVKRIFSAARPWWVGTTWVKPKRSRTADSNANHEGEPA